MLKRFYFLLLAVLMTVSVAAQKAVTLPDDAIVENDWVATFVMHSSSGDESVSESMEVAFCGSDVYFNLPNPITGNTWVKGTLSDGVATFASGQYIGNYMGSVYMLGQDAAGVCDLAFGYDETRQAFTLLDMQLVLSAKAAAIDAWAYYTGMTVAKKGSAVADQWTMSYTMHYMGQSGEQTESGTEPVEVVINGDEVAFNFPNPLNGKAWIKGTLNGTVATFPKGQQMGTYDGEPFYLVGQDATGLCDVVFNYDSKNNVFTLGDMYLLINSSVTLSQPWCYFSKATITLGAVTPEEEEDTVVVPEDLTAQDYLFRATNIIYDSQGRFDHNETVQWPIKVGFHNDDVYMRGLCQFLPLAWVKGTNDEGYVTFAGGQFMGKAPMPVYFCGMQYNQMSNVEFEMDATRQSLKGKSYIYINSSKTQLAPYDVYAGINITRLTAKAATPAAPVIERYQQYQPGEGYAALMLTIPTLDVEGNVLAPSHLGYRLFTEKDGQQQVYTFTNDKYIDLPESSMTVIPYDLATGYNFLMFGSLVYINDNLESNDRLGVQSVYTVSGKEYVSDIAWMSFGESSAIDAPVSGLRVESVTLTDLQGRRVSPSTHGLLIQTERLSDGTVRSKKVMK
jgi:hypothetical protein